MESEQAASLPLTGLITYETLFDVFGISKEPSENRGKSLLIINGAGGVGSIAAQIARFYGLEVITTVSREDTIKWSINMGADVVLNHKKDLSQQFKDNHIEGVNYILCTFNTGVYCEMMVNLAKPKEHIATIVVFNSQQDLNLLKSKSVTFTHEFMLSRPLHHTDDVIKHHEYLKDITEKVEQGYYQPITTKVIDGLDVDSLYGAHQILESHSMTGKLVISLEQKTS